MNNDRNKHLGETIRKSILAGICIGIGATVYLSCPNKYIAATLFGIGLYLICTYNFNLFTGKIGYAIKLRKQYLPLYYIEIWIGNFIGCALVVLPLRVGKPELISAAKSLMDIKITHTIPQMIILGMMCGVMMFIAVNTYKSVSTSTDEILSIFFPVVIFILCGFEHSIANMCYALYAVEFNITQIVTYLIYILIISLSNAVGSLLFCSLKG